MGDRPGLCAKPAVNYVPGRCDVGPIHAQPELKPDTKTDYIVHPTDWNT